MGDNYNDIIDVILTFSSLEELNELIIISGDVVPYLILGKKFKGHFDFNILIREKNLNFIRKKIEDISKEYEIDIISDSLEYNDKDYGFKMIYQDTKINFIPYSIVNNNFFSKHYHVNNEENKIKLTIKKVSNITKNSIIKNIKLDDKIIKVLSPEFLLANMEIKRKNNIKVIELLSELSDESVLRILRNKVSKTIVLKKDKKIRNKKFIYYIILFVILIIMIFIYMI